MCLAPGVAGTVPSSAPGGCPHFRTIQAGQAAAGLEGRRCPGRQQSESEATCFVQVWALAPGLFPRAVITKHHRLGGLNSRNVLEAGDLLKSRC